MAVAWLCCRECTCLNMFVAQLVQVLEREVFPLVKGFKDTPFIVYMLKTQSWQGEKYIDRVYFEQEVRPEAGTHAESWT